MIDEHIEGSMPSCGVLSPFVSDLQVKIGNWNRGYHSPAFTKPGAQILRVQSMKQRPKFQIVGFTAVHLEKTTFQAHCFKLWPLFRTLKHENEFRLSALGASAISVFASDFCLQIKGMKLSTYHFITIYLCIGIGFGRCSLGYGVPFDCRS